MANFYIEIYAFGSGVLVDNNAAGSLVVSNGANNAENNAWGSLQSGGDTVGPANNARIQVQVGQPRVGLWITDDDANLSDGSADGATFQSLIYPVTINGVTYPAGSRVELEYAIDVESGGDGNDFYIIRLGGNGSAEPADTGINVGIMGTTSDAIVPATIYTVQPSADGPSINFLTAACFTFGTMIETADGARVIDELTQGDLIATLDHGSQMVRWIGNRHISQIDMMANPALRPVLFDEGTIGNRRPLLVSPQHRVLLSDWRAQVYFGEDQILVPAKALINGTTIRQVMPAEGVTYCHLLFDQHEILVTEGALTESFHPSDDSLSMLTFDQQRELELLFPDLAASTLPRQTAYPVVRVQDARSLRMSA